MEASKKIIFDRNTMATTVGANSLNVEAIVSQPSNTQDELMVDGLDYVFDQAKFEEYLSSSSSRSSSPKRRRVLSPRNTQREDFPPIVVKASPCNIIPASPKAEGPAHLSATTLTKRARQRQRQKLARQFAKALESMDGVHYHTNSCQQISAPQSQSVSTPAKEEWVLVKRTRLTRKERAQKRRARAARACAILRKAQELESSKEPNQSHKIWMPKSTRGWAQRSAGSRDSRKLSRRPRDSPNCLASRATVLTVAPDARQSKLSRQLRDSSDCRARRKVSRDSSNCRARRVPSADILPRLSSSASVPVTSPSTMPLVKPGIDPNLLNCLGPLYVNRGKTPMKEHLGPVINIQEVPQTGGRSQSLNAQKCPAAFKQIGTHQYTCSCTVPRRNQETCIFQRNPIASHLSIPQGVRKPVKTPFPHGGGSKRVTYNVISSDRHMTLVHPKLYNPQSQKKMCLSNGDGAILGSGIHKRLHQQVIECSGYHADELNYQTGGASTSSARKRVIDATSPLCTCERLIKTILSRRPSVPRYFQRRRSTIQIDELPEVTINMANKGKGEAATDADPDFTPGGRVSSRISQRMSRLQLRATQRIDYRRMHEGESSEDETSDAYSAIASDDTMSSVGQAREAYTITSETLAQMLQEALAKQREELKAEMRIEMDLAMQQMRELQSQKAAQPESSQQGGSGHRVAHNIEDSDPEVDEHILADQPPKKAASGAQSGNDLTHPTGSNLKQGEDESEKMKELEGKINSLMSAQEVKKTGIPCPYPREWDSIPYPSKFNLINFTPFDGKGSPTQHLIYFKSHLGVISGNEPLMVRSFVGTLRGAAFDWYRRLKAGSINCWDDMESSFLNNFFDDDTEVSIRTLLDEKQKGGETTDAFVKRFRNKAINCKDPITEEFILQTCHNNLSIDLLEVMGVVPPTTWKELKLRGEQAERFLKRKKNERGEPTTGPSNSNFASRDKKKASTAAVNQKLQQQQRKTSDRRFQKEYSFKDEEVPVIFKYLLDGNKIKLPPITNQEEADKTSDPKYCAYHRRILHPTKDCLALKAIIQALVEAGVLTPK